MKLGVVKRRGELFESRPARGAWIETLAATAAGIAAPVAPRAGRVD